MIHNLRQALENNNVTTIFEIENKCNDMLRESMEKVGTDFQIRRNYFCEENHITDDLRDILLAGKDRTRSMVAVGR